MNRTTAHSCLLATLLLAGCADPDIASTAESSPPDADTRPVPPPPSDDALNQAIQQPLDRVRAVEDDVIGNREALDDALEEQGG
jgi:hypothetical protein